MKPRLPIAACVAAMMSLATSWPLVVAAADRSGPESGRLETLYAVEVTVGPGWDPDLSPGEQPFFTEHSAHLKSLREAGHIVMGARYSDIGLLVFKAESADAVRAMMQQDPSMAAGTFRFEVHAFRVFYPGLLEP